MESTGDLLHAGEKRLSALNECLFVSTQSTVSSACWLTWRPVCATPLDATLLSCNISKNISSTLLYKRPQMEMLMPLSMLPPPPDYYQCHQLDALTSTVLFSTLNVCLRFIVVLSFLYFLKGKAPSVAAVRCSQYRCNRRIELKRPFAALSSLRLW